MILPAFIRPPTCPIPPLLRLSMEDMDVIRAAWPSRQFPLGITEAVGCDRMAILLIDGAPVLCVPIDHWAAKIEAIWRKY